MHEKRAQKKTTKTGNVGLLKRKQPVSSCPIDSTKKKQRLDSSPSGKLEDHLSTEEVPQNKDILQPNKDIPAPNKDIPPPTTDQKGKTVTENVNDEDTSLSSDDEETFQKNIMPEFDGGITPYDVHSYLKHLFKFRHLVGNDWKLPLFTDKTYSEETPQQCLETDKKPLLSLKGNKTHLQLLHELVQKIFEKGAKIYFRKILEIRGLTDFCAEVEINDIKYGIAIGDTFKNAKHHASEVTLRMLAPSYFTDNESEKPVFQVNE